MMAMMKMKKTTSKTSLFQSDSYYCMAGADQVILIRLRTGHTMMDALMYSMLKACQTDCCPCNTAQTTGQHLPQYYPIYDAVG